MPFIVTADHPITCGVFEGFSWIRCEGKGSFLNSPLMKSFGENRVAEGETVLVVDLAECSGMDSTFMGTLAGMAARLSATEDGALQIANADARNRGSLEDLGLDFLMQINPADAPWKERLEEIRSCLEPAKPGELLDMNQRARHVLKAHEELSELNDKNAQVFDDVVNTLRKQVSDKPTPES
jgi:anti-anti-sigma regulatory factor